MTEGVYCAVPQRRGQVHVIVSQDRDAGTVTTACKRTFDVRGVTGGTGNYRWVEEPNWRTGWDYHVDCKRCQKATEGGAT